MSRYSVLAIALLCASGTALAQTAAAPPPRAWQGGHHPMRGQMAERMEQRRMEQLTVLLDLTSAQQEKVKTILRAEHERMRQSVEQALRQVRETHRAVRKDTLQKLSGVLSPAQMKKFQVLMSGPGMMRHGAMMMRGMGHGMGGGPPAGAGPGPN